MPYGADGVGPRRGDAGGLMMLMLALGRGLPRACARQVVCARSAKKYPGRLLAVSSRTAGLSNELFISRIDRGRLSRLANPGGIPMAAPGLRSGAAVGEPARRSMPRAAPPARATPRCTSWAKLVVFAAGPATSREKKSVTICRSASPPASCRLAGLRLSPSDQPGSDTTKGLKTRAVRAGTTITSVNGPERSVDPSRARHSGDLMRCWAAHHPVRGEVKSPQRRALGGCFVNLKESLGKGVRDRPIGGDDQPQHDEVFFDNLKVPAESDRRRRAQGASATASTAMNAERIPFGRAQGNDRRTGRWGCCGRASTTPRSGVVFDKPIGHRTEQGVQFRSPRAYGRNLEGSDMICPPRRTRCSTPGRECARRQHAKVLGVGGDLARRRCDIPDLRRVSAFPRNTTSKAQMARGAAYRGGGTAAILHHLIPRLTSAQHVLGICRGWLLSGGRHRWGGWTPGGRPGVKPQRPLIRSGHWLKWTGFPARHRPTIVLLSALDQSIGFRPRFDAAGCLAQRPLPAFVDATRAWGSAARGLRRGDEDDCFLFCWSTSPSTGR